MTKDFIIVITKIIYEIQLDMLAMQVGLTAGIVIGNFIAMVTRGCVWNCVAITEFLIRQ